MAAGVLIAGGGVAALEAALVLQELAPGQADVELLAPEPEFWYRPLAIGEPFGLGQVRHFELAALAAAAGAAFSLGSLHGIDTDSSQALTSRGPIPYDLLLIACGATPTVAVQGALTFRGPTDTDKVRLLLREIAAGEVHRVTFVVPWGAVWSLPLYELALMTATHAEESGMSPQIQLLTPEQEPLQVFGHSASHELRRLLDERQIEFHPGVSATAVVNGELRLVPEGRLAADRVVALPRLRGAPLDGVPQTVHGFIPVDAFGEVRDLVDVFAAGDITNSPVKQGGLATQQADAAAEAIAFRLGADVRPTPFRPVLRGLLLTGGPPRFLRRDVTEHAEAVSAEPLWWPPSKIVGRELAPFLALIAGVESSPERESPAGWLPIEVEVEERVVAGLATPLLPKEADGVRVGEVMSPEPIAVAPEDTLGELAEKLRAADAGSAVVADHGRLIGILTSRDLLRAFAARVHPSEARAREWMTAEPVSIASDAPIEIALALMTEYGIHHLPVVQGERPVGMLGLRQAARLVQPAVGLGLGL